MNLKKTLFNIILFFSLTVKADYGIKETYDEIFNIIKLYCKEGQYFYPPKKRIIRSNLEYPVLGLCYTDKETYWDIFIDSGYWLTTSKDMQFELLAHEIEHCMFFRKHVDNEENFMYPSIRNLTKEEVKQQLINNLNEDCKKK